MGITTGFYWKESSDGTRQKSEASLADLEELWEKALWTNETLVWKSAWAEPAPAGHPGIEVQAARRIAALLPSRYGRFYDRNGKACPQLIAEFSAIYIVRFDNC